MIALEMSWPNDDDEGVRMVGRSWTCAIVEAIVNGRVFSFSFRLFFFFLCGRESDFSGEKQEVEKAGERRL